MTAESRGFLLVRMRPWVVPVCLALLAAAGCGHKQANAVPQETRSTAGSAGKGPLVTLDESLEGKVVKFEKAGKFVVLNFPVGHLPSAGQRLFVYRMGKKVGEVTTTGWRRDDSVVADVSSGEAAEGDVVRDR